MMIEQMAVKLALEATIITMLFIFIMAWLIDRIKNKGGNNGKRK